MSGKTPTVPNGIAAYFRSVPPKEFTFNIIVIIFIVILTLMPTGFPTYDYPNSTRAVGTGAGSKQ